VSGEVSALFAFDGSRRPHLASELVQGKTWLVFPAKYSEYTFYVGDQPARLRVPADFHDVDALLLATYFRDRNDFAAQWEQAANDGRLREVGADGGYRIFQLPLGRKVKAGDPVLRFDLLKGDMLIVDRLSYHFVRPRVGSAFVFETEAIPDFPAGDDGSDEFLIKRLVGLPGDSLEIREPALYRNGQPITGAEAFVFNAARVNGYRGYFNAPETGGRYLFAGQAVTVPPHSFMGLGDNSLVSEDGRYWGFVPERDVQGRPLFIYYPFSRHWGFAK
jgi:signal peptidase I